MPVKASEITSLVERLAPKNFAENWDNTGWQVGSPDSEVDRVLVVLDIDEGTLEEALQKNARLVVSHHPLIMKELKEIRFDTVDGNLISRLIKNDIGVYSAHTNLDSANGGINDVLAAKLGLQNPGVLHITVKEQYLKLVVFVPEANLEDVMSALRREGAGWIGKYSDCTFQVKGTGTFRPGEGTSPYIGERGKLEKVEEVRVETIVPADIASRVVEGMKESHPYEEVAYDLYPLALDGTPGGLGRIGDLSETVDFPGFVKKVKEVLDLSSVRCGGREDIEIERVAVCTGSGSTLWRNALQKGAQVLVTGDIKYHDAKDMLSAGLNFIDAGHFGTEKIMVKHVYDYLREKTSEKGMDVEILAGENLKDPFKVL